MERQAPFMIKILFLAANPLDTVRVRTDAESRAIEECLREFGRAFTFEKQHAVRVTELTALLLRHRPQIVHFSGHGSDQGELILEDERGYAHAVPPSALSRLFALLKQDVRCVVLNTCYAAQQAQAIAEQIDFVVGVSGMVEDRGALRFATVFYQALGLGQDLATAVEVGRVQLQLEGMTPGEGVCLLTKTAQPEPLPLITQPPINQVDKHRLREKLITAFDLEELDLLCADIEQALRADGIDLLVNLELVGGRGKAAKVLNLLMYLERRDYLSYLVRALQQARPGLL